MGIEVNGACWQAKRVDRRQHVRWRAALGTSMGLLLLLAACATPVQVDRAAPRVVQRELTSDVISTGNISEPTQIVLHRQDLTERFESDPEGAIVSLHRTITPGKLDPDALFALSERLSLLFPAAVAAPNTLYTGFTNANAMLHVANCVANAGRIESGDSYKFYAEGVTPAVARLYEAIKFRACGRRCGARCSRPDLG